MSQFIKDYFTFNKRERRGIVILVLIILILLIVLNIPTLFYKEEAPDLSRYEKDITEFSALSDSFQISEAPEILNEEPERFSFNPNQLSVEDWQRLGLSEKQIKAVKSFEAAGGKFRKKEDLKKMYVISEEFYNSVEPYMKIPADSFYNDLNKPVFIKTEKKILEIEINNADSNLFKKIRGIGPAYAKRIIKYREALGGFTSIDQIMEVYGLPAHLFDTISMYLTIDTAGLIKKNINTSTLEDLRKHPYINWNVANAIVAYREKHGLYKNIYDIRKTDLVDEDLYRKIAPYLKID